jgi:hypothetical protein
MGLDSSWPVRQQANTMAACQALWTLGALRGSAMGVRHPAASPLAMSLSCGCQTRGLKRRSGRPSPLRDEFPEIRALGLRHRASHAPVSDTRTRCSFGSSRRCRVSDTRESFMDSWRLKVVPWVSDTAGANVVAIVGCQTPSPAQP